MNCRGQGYNGSSNMSSSRTGVQGHILAVSPLDFYTNYQAHQLNLCVVKGCSILQICNSGGKISQIASSSSKCQHFFLKRWLTPLQNQPKVINWKTSAGHVDIYCHKNKLRSYGLWWLVMRFRHCNKSQWLSTTEFLVSFPLQWGYSAVCVA